mgnify:FL=1
MGHKKYYGYKPPLGKRNKIRYADVVLNKESLMSIYKKLARIHSNKNTEEKLYEVLQTATYKSSLYKTEDLGEGMTVLYQSIWGWYKPRFVLNHNDKTAFEFMDSYMCLVTVTNDDIDWASLKKLPEEAIYRAECLSFQFPSFIRGFRNGVARVDWQLNPDGRYYMDDDGFGMTDDEEIEIYGFIDTKGNVLVKFKAIKDRKELEVMRKEAEEKVKVLKTIK